MKKIAIFQTDLNIGGIQKSIINILNNIDLSKYEIDLYLINKDNTFIDSIPKSINIIYLKDLPYITKLIPISILKLFYNNHITKEYDIAIDFNFYSSLCSIEALRVKANNKILWIHNDIDIKMKEEFKYKLIHILQKSKYKKYDTFNAVSIGALESFKKYHNYDNKTYNVVPNIIDTEEISNKLKDKSSITIDKSKINICSVGRLIHQKGFDNLILEINNIRNELSNHHFYIIGGGKEESSLKEMISKYNLEDYITMVGYVENPFAIMNEMDAFILLSRYEGQGMVFLEAKSLDLDIIMPKHIEKYVDGINGVDNIKESILNITKREHKFNKLEDYNNKIIDYLNNL